MLYIYIYMLYNIRDHIKDTWIVPSELITYHLIHFVQSNFRKEFFAWIRKKKILPLRATRYLFPCYIRVLRRARIKRHFAIRDRTFHIRNRKKSGGEKHRDAGSKILKVWSDNGTFSQEWYTFLCILSFKHVPSHSYKLRISRQRKVIVFLSDFYLVLTQLYYINELENIQNIDFEIILNKFWIYIDFQLIVQN